MKYLMIGVVSIGLAFNMQPCFSELQQSNAADYILASPVDIKPDKTIPGLELLDEAERIKHVQLSYTVGTADALQITVADVPELCSTVIVNNEGKINYSVIEKDVRGLTLVQFHNLIRDQIGPYIHEKPIHLALTILAEDSLIVLGAVENPGVYRVSQYKTIAELLQKAGVKKEAVLDKAALIRIDQNKVYESSFYNLTQESLASQGGESARLTGAAVLYLPMIEINEDQDFQRFIMPAITELELVKIKSK